MQETQFRPPQSEDALEQGMEIHSNFLSWKIHGQRRLVDCSPCGCKELDMTKHTHKQTHTHTNRHTHTEKYTSVLSSPKE